MRRTTALMFALAALSLLGPACAQGKGPAASPASADPAKHPYAAPAKLEALVSGADTTPYLLLDVRTAEEFAAGHIKGAVLLPYDTIGPSTAPAVPTDRLILVYCRSGRRSAIAATALKGLGFSNVADFGGINRWTGELITGKD